MLRRSLLAGLLSTALVAAGAPAAAAHRDRTGSPLVKPGHRVQGLTPGEWLGRWWKAVLETSAPEASFPGCLPLGRDVVAVVVPFGGGEGTCTVRRGSQLMLVPDTTSCSDYEDEPYHGDTPAERRECARLSLEAAGVHEVAVDGRHVRLDDAYRAQAPDRRATLPEGNFLGAPAGTRIRFGAEGWVAFTKPLARGRHEIVEHATGISEDVPYDFSGRLQIDVV